MIYSRGWGGNGGAGTRIAALFLTTRILALFPTSCAGRGQLSFHRHGTQVIYGIATLDMMEEKTVNKNSTHMLKNAHTDEV